MNGYQNKFIPELLTVAYQNTQNNELEQTIPSGFEIPIMYFFQLEFELHRSEKPPERDKLEKHSVSKIVLTFHYSNKLFY